MATQVSVCNMALQRFGDLSIADINENTRESRACKNAWDQVRDELIAAYNWRFAIKRYEFGSYLSDTPAFPEDTYYYELPTDCLRVLEIYEGGSESEAEWNIEGNKLITQIDEDLGIRYVARITDVSQYGPQFVSCLACALSGAIAPKLTDNAKVRAEIISELPFLVSKAQKLNAIEGNKNKSIGEQGPDAGNFSWQKEGR